MFGGFPTYAHEVCLNETGSYKVEGIASERDLSLYFFLKVVLVWKRISLLAVRASFESDMCIVVSFLHYHQ